METPEPMATMLKLIKEQNEKGAEYADLWGKVSMTKECFNESLEWMLERGLIYEPIQGMFKVI
jgi:hypothetical protein